jgi:hypothetical protein
MITISSETDKTQKISKTLEMIIKTAFSILLHSFGVMGLE